MFPRKSRENSIVVVVVVSANAVNASAWWNEFKIYSLSSHTFTLCTVPVSMKHKSHSRADPLHCTTESNAQYCSKLYSWK